MRMETDAEGEESNSDGGSFRGTAKGFDYKPFALRTAFRRDRGKGRFYAVRVGVPARLRRAWNIPFVSCVDQAHPAKGVQRDIAAEEHAIELGEAFRGVRNRGGWSYDSPSARITPSPTLPLERRRERTVRGCLINAWI